VTELSAATLGDLAWVTMPGEPVSALGRAIKEAARQRWPHVIVAGVSNDYLGYFVREADYARNVYVTCAAVYGPQVGPCLVDGALTLLEELGPEARSLRSTGVRPAPCEMNASAR
jgi:hypothetical protein